MHNTRQIIAYACFFILGFGDGLLGVAWPSMRDTFAVSLDAVGLLMGALTLGYITSSAASGRLIAALGVGPYVLLAVGVRAAALAGYCAL